MCAVIRKVSDLIPQKPLVLDEIPQFTGEDYQRRINRLLALGEGEGATHLVIYGDREHYSNIEHLTGYDPRFEESLLILRPGQKPILVAGNEGIWYAEIIPYDIQVEHYSTFSLSGQPRTKRDLREIFTSAGIAADAKVGLIGWKIFDEKDFANHKHVFEIPHFIVEKLKEAAGAANLFNANHFMTGNDSGIRHQLDAKELILAEIAGTRASRNTLRVLQNLAPGKSELEVSGAFALDGEPLSTHPNVNFGTRNVGLGIASPTQSKKLEYGECVSVGMGARRALIHKAAVFARDATDLSPAFAAAVENECKAYYDAVIAWYETVAVGVTGGEVYEAVSKALGGDFEKYGIGLNPGHQSHTDEWTNSMFYKGSTATIKPGLSLQCDIIAILPETRMFLHAEDSLVIADETLREEMKALAPAAWERIVARRGFMKDVLKINLSEDVIPTSDLQGLFFPYMADLTTIFVKD